MKAKLAIVIVNYNVRYFLKQCLSSVFRSIKHIDAQVYVVDNASSDGSVDMIRTHFPDVELIDNRDNLGFGKANNQVLPHIRSEYLLYLNPDTIITEDALLESLTYLDTHDNVGALGAQLIDGAGNYHEESKRGFPSVFTALSKMTGLYKLFPKSSFFNHYYLGHLSKDQTSEVEVLCGAFILARTDLLKKLGGFDEDFFMYGEDIDLCYRIKERGYKIVYHPKCKIIHFKGESAKKLSYTYIKSFYGAMLIYLKKRQVGWLQKLLLPFFSVAVFSFAILKSVLSLTRKWFRAIFDSIILLFMTYGFAYFWGSWYHGDPTYFQGEHVFGLIAMLSFIYVAGYFVFGKYDDQKNYKSLYKGLLVSSVLVFLIYAFIPEQMRSSRIIVIVSAMISTLYLLLTQSLQILARNSDKQKQYIIVGSADSASKLSGLMRNVSTKRYLGFVDTIHNPSAIGTIDDIKDIADMNTVDEIIFSSKDLSFTSILDVMVTLGRKIKYKLASEDNVSILSSHSAKKQGQIFTVDLDLNIEQIVNQRIKRISDILFSIILIALFPLLIFLRNYRDRFFLLFQSLFGMRSVLGFKEKNDKLQVVKQGVFHIADIYNKDLKTYQLDYAKRYSILLDIEYIIQALRDGKYN